MKSLIPEFPRYRCSEAQRLYDAWTEAMTSYNPDIIRVAMRIYFEHRNGFGKKPKPCRACFFGEPH